MGRRLSRMIPLVCLVAQLTRAFDFSKKGNFSHDVDQ